MAFSVLFVCTGNICRSPMAERLLRVRVDPAARVAVSSVGTSGLTGYPMDAPSAEALRELGGNPDGHVARRFTPALIDAADLILTAETSHRSIVVQSDPLTFRRAFTLREFGRLGADLGLLDELPTEEALRDRVEEVAAQRGIVDAREAGVDEIGDPYGAPIAVARLCGAQIVDAVDAAIAALGLTGCANAGDAYARIAD